MSQSGGRLGRGRSSCVMDTWVIDANVQAPQDDLTALTATPLLPPLLQLFYPLWPALSLAQHSRVTSS